MAVRSTLVAMAAAATAEATTQALAPPPLPTYNEIFYNVPTSHEGGEKLPARDMSHHFNAVTKARQPSAIKELYKYFLLPGMANLAGGMPHPDYFPYDNFKADAAGPERLLDTLGATRFHGLSSRAPSVRSGSSTAVAARPQLQRASTSLLSLFKRAPTGAAPSSKPDHLNVRIPKYDTAHLPPNQIDLATTLQYGRATGLDPLVDFIKEFTIDHLHQGLIPYENVDILLTTGSTDGFFKTVGILGSPGDTLLCEEYCYSNAIQTAAPYGIGVAPVTMDQGGMCVDGPGGLRDVLENWDKKNPAKRRPHMMYTVTIGQNPTGATLDMDRRKEIYALCEKFDVIIIEDDPYWHLQFTPDSHPPSPPSPEASQDAEKSHRPASALQAESEDGESPENPRFPFLTIDYSGRVIRLDTFSKTIAPGCRMGWITAQTPIIEKFVGVTEHSTQQPSGFVQSLVAELLVRDWGMDGWVSWLSGLRDAYQQRMKTMCAALLSTQETVIVLPELRDMRERGNSTLQIIKKVRMYDFVEPAGGMFVWVKLNLHTHPAYREWRAKGKTATQLVQKLWVYCALEKLVLPGPGGIFAATEDVKTREDGRGIGWLRFCFAALEEGEVEPATRKWGVGCGEFWALNVDEIEAIGEGQEVGALGEKSWEGVAIRDISPIGC